MPTLTPSEPSFPAAVAPERRTSFVSSGLRLQLYEWGDPAGRPLVLCHGFFDHARGFDTLAPLLATRFRVVAIDARGHGDSDWADAYAWPSDLRDIKNLLDWLGQPAHLLGHSKGGGQVTDAAVHYADSVRQVVNIDGFGPPPDDYEHRQGPERELPAPQRFGTHLDKLRRNATRKPVWRPSRSFEELLKRRRALNPRLSLEWMTYFLHFATTRSEDGFRWKADPRVGQGFGPWKPEWIAQLWKGMKLPMLAIAGTEKDTWGPLPDEVIEQRFEHIRNVKLAKVPGTGHFVHMEQPNECADLVLSFLDR